MALTRVDLEKRKRTFITLLVAFVFYMIFGPVLLLFPVVLILLNIEPPWSMVLILGLTALSVAIAVGLAAFLFAGGKAYDPDHCSNCGYPLKGLTEPRCPECGTPFNELQIDNIIKPNRENNS